MTIALEAACLSVRTLRFYLPRSGAAALLIVAAVTGCIVPETQRDVKGRSAPLEFPQAHYRRAISEREPVFEVDPAQSLVVIEVRRAGSLARLGHDHVVASHDVQGYIAPAQGRADLYVPLAELTVDEVDLRVAAGLDTTPSAAAIEATRRNMLDKVLEVEQHPYALIGVLRSANGSASHANVSVKLHGTTRSFDVPLQVEQGAHEFAVSGRLSISQTEFGLVPFSILGGAIAVQDRLDLRFTIKGRPAAP